MMQGASNSSNILFVDEFYFSALYDEEEIFPISDGKYAEELQLQEVLIISSSSSSNITISSTKQSSSTNRDIIRLNNNHHDHHFIITPKQSLKGKDKQTGESSQSFCQICMDAKPSGDMFRHNNCIHSFCPDCIAKYVATKLQENISMIKCPRLNCEGVLDPELCRAIVPKEVFDRWEDALCESLILDSQRFYCPFKDCSALLVDNGGEANAVTVSECPYCHRLFCAQCKVVWHAGIGCGEFQNLSKDERTREDIMVMELAKNNKWRRCPKCKFYVEKVDGCLHISCRCNYEFCYGCGSKWGTIHRCLQE